MLQGKTILLGVTGGIAAYKAATLVSRLTQAGARVDVIMTEGAARFITPLALQTLSRRPVYTDTFDEQNPAVVSHIDLADRADAVVIAPATANLIAKLAHGLADDMLSTTLLATTAPLLIAPAMNVHMYAHPATAHNMRVLEERGARYVEPGEGQLACGYVGKGRLAEPEAILFALERLLGRRQLLAGKRVLVTAGGTVERIDPVRYLTNDSSGRMGFAIAEAARDMGAQVTLVAARTQAQPPTGVELIRAETAEAMAEAVLQRYAQMEIVVKAAAVADYRPVQRHAQKLKKTEERLVVELERTTDILAELGRRKRGQYLVGFAAETNDVERHALDKLKRKNCDLLVANNVAEAGAGFHGETNIVQLYDGGGLVASWPLLSKREVAERLMQEIAARLPAGAAGARGDEGGALE
ncbi:bifunctional phosphopantothenoylcysteine decarboxylase/phosphopantothenate--cysteine ligase CoaBC [Paenibacillus sp. IB182496]|uniref:Coenzyme A biosynthesis bifunctional protein CoaBC n=1 Tax=Paenibacillus sabuli TaxID=2772509 RepID=A0A927BSV7_9BACL|nr:bifunctional phosphopantothenoylcysteine decarboxylase/phosphopantothenate--cysteine ligase CoaBC [Paenibacillus sabuli]MBD2846162.1 bifunctional phosphopantothenoylcysteine decarboxylase/phosphopantothenate--cysteine ligase CoaBC [Paenibacillus sabuli]